MKITLAVLGNLALENNKEKLDTMIKHRFCEACNKAMQTFELNDGMIKSIIDALGNMIKNKETAHQVA